MSCSVIIREERCGKPTHKTETTSGGLRMEFCRQHWGFVLGGAPIVAECEELGAPAAVPEDPGHEPEAPKEEPSDAR